MTAARPASSDSTPSSDQTVGQTVLPLKPQRVLLRVLTVVFALWVVAMLVMYFKTVDRDRGKLIKVHQQPGVHAAE